MTHDVYIKCVIACLIGNLLHILIAILKRFSENRAANIPFSVGRYIKDDKWVFISDAAFSFVIVYVFDEWGDFTPWFMEKAKTFFLFVGFTGGSVFNAMLSVSKKKFIGYVDRASDVAEGKKDVSELEKPNQDLGLKQELKAQNQ